MKPLTSEQIERLERLAQRPASEIDLSDIPETLNWEGAFRGWENRPHKRPPKPLEPNLEPSLERRLREVARRQGLEPHALLERFLLERTYQEEVRLGILPPETKAG